jgi:hypothetical protein
VNWFFNNCERYGASSSLLAANALEEPRKGEVEAHLTGCVSCQTRFAELQNLARSLADAGRRLPQVEAPVSLRRRWTAAVRKPLRERGFAPGLFIPARVSGRRLAWGGLAAMWVMVLFFRVSAPEVSKPAVVAAAPPSLRAVLLALKVEDQTDIRRANATGSDPQRKSQPDILPPRSQVAPASSSNRESA